MASKRRRTPPSVQTAELPFAEAEGTRAELKNLLGIALLKAGCDLYQVQLALWIFNVTVGHGRPEPLKKSYAELGASPWGLCCHATRARSAVRSLHRAGIITVKESRVGPGSQGPNEYTLDWPGVRAWLGALPGRSTPDSGGHPPDSGGHPPDSGGHPPDSGGHPGGRQSRHTEERHLSDTSLSPSDRLIERKKAGEASFQRKAGTTTTRPRVGWAECVEEVPGLRPAASRRVSPLPAQDLGFGAFASLTDAMLGGTELVEWFRRQLSRKRPLTGDTEAHLELVLASGLNALAVPSGEVQRSRIGIFSAPILRDDWEWVTPFVPKARTNLAAWIAAEPDLLTWQDAEPQPEEATDAQTHQPA